MVCVPALETKKLRSSSLIIIMPEICRYISLVILISENILRYANMGISVQCDEKIPRKCNI